LIRLPGKGKGENMNRKILLIALLTILLASCGPSQSYTEVTQTSGFVWDLHDGYVEITGIDLSQILNPKLIGTWSDGEVETDFRIPGHNDYAPRANGIPVFYVKDYSWNPTTGKLSSVTLFVYDAPKE
jgi:hypothetical protein